METTRYKKTIKNPLDFTLLKPGKNNKKLGGVITSKEWRGKTMYSLTLTERATCPITCHHWDDCYGNNMPFAHRFDHNEDLIPKLREEIKSLLNKHSNGIVVRLHVLGDFFSEEYVDFWHNMIAAHPMLCIFGYTAREAHDPIGSGIYHMNRNFPSQCVIRHSGNYDYDDYWSYAAEESYEGKSFTCPEQTGVVKSCANCGLCWTTTKTVKFLSH